MTITNIALNENEERTMRQISRGRYGNLEASESELDCIAVVTEFCYKHIAEQETPNVLNDILAIVKKRVHIIDDNNVDQFMTTVYQDIKRSNKLAKSVMGTVLHIEDVVRDSSVLDNSFGVDVRRVVVVSLVTAAIRHYLAAVEDGEVSENGQEPNEETQSETVVTETLKDDTVEVIDVTASDVIGVAADASEKYKDAKSKSHDDASTQTIDTPPVTIDVKRMAQQIVMSGVVDKHISELSNITELGKQAAAEYMVDAMTTTFNCVDLLDHESYGDVDFLLSKVLIRWATTPKDILPMTKALYAVMQKNVIGDCFPDSEIVHKAILGAAKFKEYVENYRKNKPKEPQTTERPKAIEQNHRASTVTVNPPKSLEQRQRESAHAIVNALFPGLHCTAK